MCGATQRRDGEQAASDEKMFSRYVRGCTQVAARVMGPRATVHPQRLVPALQATQVRNLNVHEYVGMEIFQRYGIDVPKGHVLSEADDAKHSYSQLTNPDCKDVVIKSQILAGGRGLGTFKSGFEGGVHMVHSADEAQDVAEKMLGGVLVTKQTGEEGRPVDTLLMVERVFIKRELYLSILLDRETSGPMIVASAAGGTSIEDVAAATPEKIIKVPIDVNNGPTDEQLATLAAGLEFTGDAAEQMKDLAQKLYHMFTELDMTMVEINPLAETVENRILVCDGKLNFDDNAAFRQKPVFDRRDLAQEDPREVAAAEHDLNYIGLDGSIGCMVNGAGLAMATLDIISLHGGTAANFLDVGGGANRSQIEHAFQILNDDKHVKAILVNIFGGIMRCDVIAHGMIAAAENIGLKKPVIVRLEGTNVEKAMELVNSSSFRMIMANDLDDAATKAVRIANIVKQAEEIQVGVSFELPL